MKTTTNYGLKKPDGTDAVDIADFNENADIIDSELAKKIDRTGAVSDMTVNFSQSGSRVNLIPGEKISTAFGKISKFFADLKTVAFSGNYNDLTNRPTIPSGGATSYGVANNCTTNVPGFVLDAQQGENLQKQINVVNSNLGGLTANGAVTKFTPQVDGLYATYKVGADTVTKKLGKDVLDLGLFNCIVEGAQTKSARFDIRPQVPDYSAKTIDNFIVQLDWARINASNTYCQFSYSYGSGIITISADNGWFLGNSSSSLVKVRIFYKG